jgi:hypothetical protein
VENDRIRVERVGEKHHGGVCADEPERPIGTGCENGKVAPERDGEEPQHSRVGEKRDEQQYCEPFPFRGLRIAARARMTYGRDDARSSGSESGETEFRRHEGGGPPRQDRSQRAVTLCMRLATQASSHAPLPAKHDRGKAVAAVRLGVLSNGQHREHDEGGA